MPKKPTHGGSRPGAGRKPTGNTPKVSTGIRLAEDVMAYARENGIPLADTLEAAIRRTKAFNAWSKQR
jgi:uncharacterized protein (DUF4415 family)